MVNPTMIWTLYSVFNVLIEILTRTFLMFIFNLELTDINMHHKTCFKNMICRF
jgi:hypothetical protein